MVDTADMLPDEREPDAGVETHDEDNRLTPGFVSSVPDSYMSVISGACVMRARLQAADGAPIPTKQMSSFLSARAAAIVIISDGE